MYSKLAFVLGYALAAGETSDDTRFTLTGVYCDGAGEMVISYDFGNADNADEKLDNFECGAGLDRAAKKITFDPYTCKGAAATGDDMESYNIDASFTIHATAQISGEIFNLKKYTMAVKCEFVNTYDVTSKPSYTVTEENEGVSFGAFTMSGADFTIELSSDDLSANEALTATFQSTGAKWAKLDDTINFAPTSCTVSETGKSFQILGGLAGACGYDELLSTLTDSSAGRRWDLQYQTFVLSSNGGTYTLTCTVTMCTPANREAGGSCYDSFEC